MNPIDQFSHQHPLFEFDIPIGYKWLLERNLVGFDTHSQLQPWYYLDRENVFSVTQKWPQVAYSKGELIAFARRQDCDDIACFSVKKGGTNAIVVIRGWIDAGYEVINYYASFWEWVKSVIDDIAFLVG
ncbi:MAG: hypothetical protein IAE79_00635 [Anaerolinea sp.]|nr:hypothetical protein [Anaerolinea sp.]